MVFVGRRKRNLWEAARGVSLARRQHPFRSPFDATAVDDRNVGSRGFRWGRSRFHGPARGIFVDSRS